MPSPRSFTLSRMAPDLITASHLHFGVASVPGPKMASGGDRKVTLKNCGMRRGFQANLSPRLSVSDNGAERRAQRSKCA